MYANIANPERCSQLFNLKLWFWQESHFNLHCIYIFLVLFFFCHGFLLRRRTETCWPWNQPGRRTQASRRRQRNKWAAMAKARLCQQLYWNSAAVWVTACQAAAFVFLRWIAAGTRMPLLAGEHGCSEGWRTWEECSQQDDFKAVNSRSERQSSWSTEAAWRVITRRNDSFGSRAARSDEEAPDNDCSPILISHQESIISVSFMHTFMHTALLLP